MILLGIAVIMVGMTAKRFNPAFMREMKPDAKPTPLWLGRTIYFAVGVWCIYTGFSYIRHP
jgi:hypothetical protein